MILRKIQETWIVFIENIKFLPSRHLLWQQYLEQSIQSLRMKKHQQFTLREILNFAPAWPVDRDNFTSLPRGFNILLNMLFKF